MGQEASSVVDEDTPPDVLSERTLSAVADLIQNGKASKIVVLTGAGLSTAAGIPDFRSPKTGLYNNLARLNLPHPEAVFDIEFFNENPYPFYLLAKELYPGKFHPTISHVFIALLARKGLLHKLFTQNIDCLERQAGVPSDLIVEAHGSFATQRCVKCKTEFPDNLMREHVERGKPALCLNAECGDLVKPDIVFFGERLPDAFYDATTVPAESDLMIILGTSLTVHPFASLPLMARGSTPRVLFNLERVGDLGTRADDVICLGDCDAGIRKLAEALGWGEELEQLWISVVGEKEAQRQREKSSLENDGDAAAAAREEELEGELQEIVDGVAHKLDISSSSTEGKTGSGDGVADDEVQGGENEKEKTGQAAATGEGAGVVGEPGLRAEENPEAKAGGETDQGKEEIGTGAEETTESKGKGLEGVTSTQKPVATADKPTPRGE
ncbi:DHS-like NAD/FAD-binding domain-containing protein [Xylariomycetidae sp. FL2044]|nr:DHS-like NAD/FAD-binding domain-containing protein [Xylariomycetidae sp. FL2044]